MGAPKPVPKPKRPSAIKMITCKGCMDSYDRQKKRFLKDPLYRNPKNLRKGTNAFTGPIHKKIPVQWPDQVFDNQVRKEMKDIRRDAVPSDKQADCLAGSS